MSNQFVITQFREHDRRMVDALLIGGSVFVEGSDRINDLGFHVALVAVEDGRAQMQADRFSSGLIGARPTASLIDATAVAGADFGVDWSALTVPSL